MQPDVLLVGCGKMGEALAERWQTLRLCRRLLIVDPISQPLKSAKDLPADFVPQAVVFAVKPQTLPKLVGDYRAFARQGALILSIAAGTPIAFFEQHLGAEAKVVRSMPNTPAAIGQGITVACANSNASADERALAQALLSAVGRVLWTEKEELLNPVTALSGSGPAYVFLLIETLTHAGTEVGLDPAMAQELARQTVIGSAALAAASPDVPAAKLRQNVTSPGGTTAAALAVLMAGGGMQDLFNRALAAATKRAEELSGGEK